MEKRLWSAIGKMWGPPNPRRWARDVVEWGGEKEVGGRGMLITPGRERESTRCHCDGRGAGECHRGRPDVFDSGFFDRETTASCHIPALGTRGGSVSVRWTTIPATCSLATSMVGFNSATHVAARAVPVA